MFIEFIKYALREHQGYFKVATKVMLPLSLHLLPALNLIQGCFREASKMFSEFFKGASRMLSGFCMSVSTRLCKYMKVQRRK